MQYIFSDDDILIGGGQDDILIGGQGGDTLIGGAGDDILIGAWVELRPDHTLNFTSRMPDVGAEWAGYWGGDRLQGGVGNDQYYVSHPLDYDIDNQAHGDVQLDWSPTIYSYACLSG